MSSQTKAHEGSTKNPMMGFITKIVNYLRDFNLLDTVLPKSHVVAAPAKTEATTATAGVHEEEKEDEEEEDLFPKKIVIQKEVFQDSSAVACSTNSVNKLVKVENYDGSISWKFDQQPMDALSSITSPFLTSTGSTVSGGFSPMIGMNMYTTTQHHKDSPSPLGSTTQPQMKFLSNSDVDSNNSLEEELAKIPDLPNPEFFNINGRSHYDHNDEDEEEEEDEEGDESDASIDQKTGKKKRKSYTCEYCGAEFRIRGYLTRHVKKHALNKAYECPFFDPHSDNKCHPNGGFSRRDTYKTHLKARHFKYPPGTRSQDRAITPGKCALCAKPYQSNEDWVEKHIESGECEGLPKGYTGRVKNSRLKNYQYPSKDGSGQQISPVSSNSGNDSPMTSKSSPQHLVMSQHSTVPSSVTPSAPVVMGMGKYPTNGLDAVHISNEHDYDNNDEFSLDVEQCMFFTPV